MWRLVLFLIFTLVLVPVVTIRMDEPLTSLQTTILNQVIAVYAVSAALCFLISTVTGNYSQVDKIWSIIPFVYAWIIAHGSGYEPRVVLMAVLITLWGIRLSYNFSRRGGYSWKFWSGEEDYRWPVLRARPEFRGKLRWGLFNLFFISGYQMALLVLITLPALKSIGGVPLGSWDYLLAILFIGLLVLETAADQQQWNFHREKYRRMSGDDEPGPYAKGFCDTGLWAWSRHPNYLAEQVIWINVYLFSVVATGKWINWSIAGCLLLILLFKGSSDFSEEISASKYPEYKDYQRRVGRFLPGVGIVRK